MGRNSKPGHQLTCFLQRFREAFPEGAFETLIPSVSGLPRLAELGEIILNEGSGMWKCVCVCVLCMHVCGLFSIIQETFDISLP